MLTMLFSALLCVDDAGSLPVLPGEVSLEVGQTKQFHVRSLERIAVSAGVVEVKSVGGGVLEFTGREEGRTSCLLWVGGGKRRSVLVTVVRSGAAPRAQPPPP